ncbi:phage tail protein [Cellulomonas sp. McL0617]|uniref:phage tail protein n=1 Tax=Cellulomonas sp. McL0617 TaxID=3415675 RepID=UPI003CF6F349
MPETPLGGDLPVTSNFVFEVDGVEIGHFQEVSGLQLTVSTHEYIEGGQNQYVQQFPGVIRWPHLVFKRGLVDSDALFTWVGKSSGEGFAGNQNKVTRATGAVTVISSSGTRLRAWEFEGVFAVAWSGPTLSTASSSALTETLEVAHNGFRAKTL